MKPSLFSDLDFDSALAQATTDGKVLLVDATASWCQPCKAMDRMTWADAKVIDAVKAHAVAIQIDVDESKEVAQKLAIKAMPTVVAFRNGKELDRVVGMQAPAAVIGWLEGLGRGETSLDRARAAARDKPTDAKLRMSLARKLVEAGELDEATTELAWVWENTEQHDMMFVFQVHELVGKHAPARAPFERLRAATPPGAKDWFLLNAALNDPDHVLAWFDANRESIAADAELAMRIQREVIPILAAKGRWADAGNAYVDPLARFREIAGAYEKTKEALKGVPEEQRTAMVEKFMGMLLGELTSLRRALHEAHRDEDVRAVEAEAAKIDPAWLTPLDG